MGWLSRSGISLFLEFVTVVSGLVGITILDMEDNHNRVLVFEDWDANYILVILNV